MIQKLEIIGEDRIPEPDLKARMFLALAEGRTVLAVGFTPLDEGEGVADVIGFYKAREDGAGYRGWVHIKADAGSKRNGYFYAEKLDAAALKLYPGWVSYIAFADDRLADKETKVEVLNEIVQMILYYPGKKSN